MKTKRILAALLSFVLVGQITPVFAEEVQNADVLQAAVNDEGAFDVSSLFTKVYENDFSVSEPDYSLFDKFLKYSLLISDKDSLTQEQLNLCKKIFATERTYMTAICDNAREKLKNDSSKRINLDDKRVIAAFADLQYIPYSLTVTGPDINYYYYRGPGGDYSSYSEYWIDDYGKERIIDSTEYNDAVYEIYYDSEPGPFEVDELIEKCDSELINLNPEVIKCDNGTFKYTGVFNTDKYNGETDKIVHSSDIWKYELLEDGSALIVGCNLPVDDKAELITETTVLPDEIDGHTVYGIYNTLERTGITSLEIPDNYQFVRISGMENLKKIKIDSPDLVLGNSSIVNCPNLSEIMLNVKSVESNAVCICDNLKKLVIIGAEGISYDAFANLPELSEVTLSEGLIYIGQDAFKNTAVKELKIPNSVEIMGVIKNPYVSHDGEIIDPLTDDCVLIADEDCEIICEANMEVQNYLAAKEIKYGSAKNAELGDVNADGKVDLTDLTELSLAIIEDKTLTESQIKAADIDENGKTDLPDLARLRQYLSKVIDSLRPGKTESKPVDAEELLIGYDDDGNSKPVTPHKIAVKCQKFCNAGEMLNVDVALGSTLILYDSDEKTTHYIFYVYDGSVIIKEKEYPKEEWSNLDLSGKAGDYNAWQHEFAEISFDKYKAGDSGSIWGQFMYSIDGVPHEVFSEYQQLYYYVGENGVGLGINITDAKEEYFKRFSDEIKDEQYKLIVTDISNCLSEPVNDTYKSGETVTLKLNSLTEGAYKINFNNTEEITFSGTTYTFVMPESDVEVSIELVEDKI